MWLSKYSQGSVAVALAYNEYTDRDCRFCHNRKRLKKVMRNRKEPICI